MGHQNPIWFKNKYFGWGWRPATWQGWLVTFSYAGALALLILWFKNQLSGISATDVHSINRLTFLFIVKIAALTAILLGVCLKFGEKPRWHWGYKDDDAK